MFHGATTKFNPRKIFVAIEIAKISSCENFGRAQIEKIHFRKIIKQKSRFFSKKLILIVEKREVRQIIWKYFELSTAILSKFRKKNYVEKVFENQPDANIRLICYMHSMR